VEISSRTLPRTPFPLASPPSFHSKKGTNLRPVTSNMFDNLPVHCIIHRLQAPLAHVQVSKIFIDVQNGLPYYSLIMMYTRRRFFVGIGFALVKALTEKMLFFE
jgi:hypothetical protein